MKAVIVVAGTQDARRIIEELLNLKHLTVHATVATALGQEFLQSYRDLRIHSGRRDKGEITELIDRVAAAALIDASHPFAVEISRNAMAACAARGIPYLRYEREETLHNPRLSGGNLIIAADFQEAAAKAALIPGNILLTVGSNHLEAFTAGIPDYRERLYVRVLPESRAIAKCESLGLTARQIIALKGPFSEALNREIYQYCQAAAVVTKDSGAAGGNPEKLAAAAQLNLPLIMVTRPPVDYGARVFSIAAIIEFGKGLGEV